jgi:hypothetical protein
MTVKLQIYKSRICVQYDALQYKKRTKSFKDTDFKGALDFVNSLADKYIGHCDEPIYNWAVRNEHPVLSRWCMCFA